jgi:hypothetical protein
VTLYYRRHSDNMTLQREKDMAGLLHSFKRSLDRRRAESDIVRELPSLGLINKRTSGID